MTVLALVASVVPLSVVAVQEVGVAPAAAATTNSITLGVVSARTEPAHVAANGDPAGPVAEGDAVSAYQWIVNRDDTGDPTQPRFPDCMPNGTYPAGCDWPSVHNFAGGSASVDSIVAQGDDTDLNTTTSLNLPDGQYLISVIADGYKIDGTHFSVPLEDPGLVTVAMQPYPLPLATLRIQVFQDSSTNGQYDVQLEPPLAGFVAHISDVLGEVTTNWYGDPLCGGQCVSDADGVVTIPDLGPNRYSAQVVPPDGQDWVLTTTLEGGKDFDNWIPEGSLGLDTEMIVGGELAPAAWFGFVPRSVNFPTAGTGEVKGRVVSTKSYLPPAGGETFEGPVDRPWVAINDLGQAGDQLVYVNRGNADGTFDITGVPAGTYQFAFWDDKLELLLGVTNVVVPEGQVVDIGDFALPHWFAEMHGTVFIDTNENGKQDPGEAGLAGQAVQLLARDNSIVDAGSKVVTTDANGHYSFPHVYPYAYWTVQQVYNDRFRTTGVTYQADNQPTETTVLTAQVDVAMLNQDGLNSRLDWGLVPYAPGENGGIVGTVYYATTRNELDARLQATEDYEAGIPGVTVNLYATVKNPDGSFVMEPDGSYRKGPELNSVVTETFGRPTDCQARNAGGVPLDLLFAPPATGGFECVESPLMGNQVGVSSSTVNGNYGFTTMLNDPVTGALLTAEAPLPPGDYLVEVDVPDDAQGNPKVKVVREEDLNVFGGDQFAPQVPPPPCAGPLHTVDSSANPSFVDAGGSPYEGQARPLCDMKLVTLNDRRSIAPTFNYFTDVPLPGRLYGAIVEDLALGTDPQEFYYGEKAGIPNAPIGVYDYSGRQVFTDQSDPNGFFEMLLPSTSSYNCPLPAGPCPNMYRLVGNDPGQPGRPNLNYDAQYRTLASTWQIWPNQTLLADVALPPTAPVIEIPGTQTTHPPECPAAPDTPQLFAVSQPYGGAGESFTVDGQGFGPSGTARLGTTTLTVNSWSDSHLDLAIPTGPSAPDPGPRQLEIRRDANGTATVNGLTFHVIGAGYAPTVLEVGPGRAYTTVQSALDAAAGAGDENLVVVYPDTPGAFTPLGDHYETIVVHSPVKLQGVGPGGVRASDGSGVPGSILNGLGYSTTPSRAQAWRALVDGLRTTDPWSGNQNAADGEVVYVLAAAGEFTSSYAAAIDGFTIIGGNEAGPADPGVANGDPVQGGGIFVNAHADHLRVTNNVIKGNSGAYAGAIRVGTPGIGDNHNDDVRIAHNRILANGGTNLAGGVGLYAGSNGYEIDHNDICGNFSAEYGGGISHFGKSGDPATDVIGTIHHNRIYLNHAYDEGGGVMIAGEPAADPTQLSPGAGPVDIHDNVIQSNMSDDDGGGIRFLESGDFPTNVFNNMIDNNVATHEGGGVALSGAPDLRFFNNTVAKNVTTATSAASAGNPAPAGLSDEANSAQLQATLPADHPTWSNPLLFNNVFWDNRAGSWDGVQVTGIGLPGDPSPPNQWDLGFSDASGPLEPTHSVLTGDANSYVADDPSNVTGVDPGFVSPFDTVIRFLGWRGNPHVVFSYLVAADVAPAGAGNYHLADYATSPANDLGQATQAGVDAPARDIDGDVRPPAHIESGADQDPILPSPDGVGPDTSNVALAPAATGGSAVTLTADISDAGLGGSTVVGAEYYVGADPGAGLGTSILPFPTPAVDVSVSASVDPGALSLPEGVHDVFVRGRDLVGNWGAPVSVALKVDQTAPDITGVDVTPNPTHGAASVHLSATASDPDVGGGPGTRIAAAEYYVDTDPGAGSGLAMTAVDGNLNSTTEAVEATLSTLAFADESTHTLCVRARDNVGNWAPTASCAALAVSDVIFQDSFESGNTSAWSSMFQTPTPVAQLPRLTVTGSAALPPPAGGSNLLGLRVKIIKSKNVYLQDNSPVNEASYRARFFFDPNTTGSIAQTLFVGRAANGSSIFDLRMRKSSGQFQLRARVRRNNGTFAVTSWITITDAPHRIELVWTSSASPATFNLRIDGNAPVAPGGGPFATGNRRLESVRLGAIDVEASGTTFELIDGFVSTRTHPIVP